MIVKGNDLDDKEFKSQLAREIKSLIEAKYLTKFQIQFKVKKFSMELEVSPYL